MILDLIFPFFLDHIFGNINEVILSVFSNLNINFLTSFIILFHHPVRAIIFFIACFSFFQYAQNRDKSFLYYSIYLFLSFFSFIYIINNDLKISNYVIPISYEIVSLYLPPAVVLFYFLFIQSILDLKNEFPQLYKALKWTILSIIGYLGILFLNGVLFNIIGQDFILRVSIIMALIVGFILMKFVPSLWRSNEKVNRFVILGSLIIFGGLTLTCFSLVESDAEDAYFFNLLTPYFGNAKENDFLILQISSLIEILLFSSALGAKAKQNENRIRNTERELFTTQLAIKDQEVLEQSLELEKQKRLQLESQFQQKIAEAEVKALKAQMNPHFIFNCLNTFKLLIQKNETDKAEEYLIKFSRLLRAIVDFSQDATILLEKELETCQLYLEMESLRFHDNFQYEINVDESIDTSFIEVPPFILQPFLENSIWHGLQLKEGEKKVSIEVKFEKDQVVCKIKDNGIGLKKSKEIQKNQTIKKRSVGMKNTEERLNLFQELQGTTITTSIDEEFDKNGISQGVQVEIIIPQ